MFADVRLSHTEQRQFDSHAPERWPFDSKFLAACGDAVVNRLPIHLVEGVVLGARAEEGPLVVDVVFDSMLPDNSDRPHAFSVGLASAEATAE